MIKMNFLDDYYLEQPVCCRVAILPIYEITKILNIYFKSDKIFRIFYLEVSHISR